MTNLFVELTQEQEAFVSGGGLIDIGSRKGDKIGSKKVKFGNLGDTSSGDLLADNGGSVKGKTGDVNIGNIR